MPITDTFDVPDQTFRQGPAQTGDTTAIDFMWTLTNTMADARHLTYSRGTWGYTIFRTVFTEESGGQFPIAMEKMQKWVTQYYLHHNRFRKWGEKGLENEKPDGSVNDELARRFRVELIEDRELDIPLLKNATPGDLGRLCDVFHRWVVSVGGDPDCRNSATNPRMQLFLAIDSECLEELANMTDELLPLNTAPTHEEWGRRIQTRPGWIWGFDYHA
ncbi:hypothetical protein B0T10DRAFT_500725, partial [Thelonectria olida]